MKLAGLIRDIDGMRVIGNADCEVRAVVDDSRRVEPGDVFVAVPGLHVDGHSFVAQAVAQGAAAVVVERPVEPSALSADVVQVVVPRSATALGYLAARHLGDPAEQLVRVGITGTNGKTTTSYLIEAVLKAAGVQPGVIGTVSYRYASKVMPAPYTTPTPLVLHRAFADMVAAGCTHAVMEVSSIALDMERLAAVDFDVAVFTNLTQDHLDIHGSMEAYRDAKARLFRHHLAAGGVAVVNVDDPAAAHMIAAAEAVAQRRVLRVATSAAGATDAEVRVVRADSTVAGIRADIATPRGVIAIESGALIGAYNVANLATAVAVGEALGLAHDDVARGIKAMFGVPGRVERVANDRGLDIVVDYAHTPDALANVLAALRPLARRRLLCVFGCGGDRDPDKRPKMGAVVARDADLAIVTSDNPRTEDPQAIIDAILPAVPAPFFVDPDRRVAIAAAVFEATPGDIVLIAGKGHEDYQILGTRKTHFDDREEAARAAAMRWQFPRDEMVAVADGTVTHCPAGGAQSFARIHIDGRIAAPGDLYVAIRGGRFDGHGFCAQAVAAGATGLVVERGRSPRDDRGAPLDAVIIEVDDTRRALAAMARWHRRRWGTAPAFAATADSGASVPRPVVGITGSSGKTTTKELVAAALSGRYRLHASPGSLNNETGVPLTLLGLRPHHDAAVVEMAMRGVGEIDYLTRIAEPTVAAVVNAGTAHVGVVGSADAIARGKSEIFGHLPAQGTAVYPADDMRLASYAAAAPQRLTFGAALAGRDWDRQGAEAEVAGSEGAAGAVAAVDAGGEMAAVGAGTTTSGRADVCLTAYRAFGTAGAEVVFAIGTGAAAGRVTAQLSLLGQHNAINAACALACAVAAGVPVESAAAGLGRAQPLAMRGQLTKAAGRYILNDCYNANPASTRAALATLAELSRLQGGRAVAVLGDMLELGQAAEVAHTDAGREAADLGIAVIATGNYAAALVRGAGAQGQVAADHNAAAALALAGTAPGDWILVKASRGMRLERVIESIQRQDDARLTDSRDAAKNVSRAISGTETGAGASKQEE